VILPQVVPPKGTASLSTALSMFTAAERLLCAAGDGYLCDVCNEQHRRDTLSARAVARVEREAVLRAEAEAQAKAAAEAAAAEAAAAEAAAAKAAEAGEEAGEAVDTVKTGDEADAPQDNTTPADGCADRAKGGDGNEEDGAAATDDGWVHVGRGGKKPSSRKRKKHKKHKKHASAEHSGESLHRQGDGDGDRVDPLSVDAPIPLARAPPLLLRPNFLINDDLTCPWTFCLAYVGLYLRSKRTPRSVWCSWICQAFLRFRSSALARVLVVTSASWMGK